MADARQLILDTIREKSTLKQDVFAVTTEQFKLFKTALRAMADELKSKITSQDERVTFEYRDEGEHGALLKFAGDILIFQMHTNVFGFDQSHPLWKTDYLKENPGHAYCGMVNVYNFLADSYKYNRFNDAGYLVARVFINKEKHFFVEGQGPLGTLYKDFTNSELDEGAVQSIVESAMAFALDFDLLTPPFDAMKEASVGALMEMQREMRVKTGKRLGYRFQSDNDFMA